MKQNDRLYGFVVKYVQELPEIKAKLVRMEYEKNGADLCWLDRDDDNMTFGIAFKTIPQDDTGVFHILEHSVLSGSKKYPVKEPFVELLKSSMNTFLNAFTYPDKTVYPVCSRNRQDFLNLMDVYLDAVLHPLCIEDPQAFLQEGWHYELESPEGELSINGVVYNEMKGAYASPDTVLNSELSRLLFPDNCYGFESGGHPDHIPELTYENYLASHHRFYHPSNARIFLDGSIDTDAVLGKLDQVLSAFDRLEMDTAIPMQTAVKPGEHTLYYEIGPEEDASNKAILAKGMVYGTYRDAGKTLAASMLKTVLCGSNEAPLMRALLEKGLAEDMEFEPLDGVQQPYTVLVLRNVKPENKDEAWNTVETTLRGLIRDGLDKKQLHAALDALEFTNREKEFGGMPTGLIYGLTAMESWLYDGDPAQNLCREDVFRTLREGIDNGYFEGFLEELLDAPHQATICMLPSKTLGAEKQEKERRRLAEWKASRSPAWLDGTAKAFALFRERQNTPDTPEQLATLPVLSLKDIPEENVPIGQQVSTLDGVTVLHENLDTNGIVHLELYFSLKDIPAGKLHAVRLLGQLLGQVATRDKTVLEVRSELYSKLGRFRADAVVLEKDRSALPYLVLRVSLLESRKADAVALIGEVLQNSRFDDQEFIFNFLRQERMALEQAVIGAGNRFAALRAGSGCSEKGTLDETISGITHLRWLQDTERGFDGKKDALRAELEALKNRLFSKSRVLANVTGSLDAQWLREVLSVLGDAPMGSKVPVEVMRVGHVGFAIPAEIGFAAKAGKWEQRLEPAAFVASQMLTYGHLWTEVRVKGGAYGTGMRAGTNGSVVFSSYRDPNPLGAMAAFDASGQFLRDFCDSDETVDRYIISTVAEIDPLMTPRTKGAVAASRYLTGHTAERQQAERSGVLHTTKEDLRRFSRVLDAMREAEGICVVGGKNVLDACGDKLDTVEALQ